MSPVVSDSDSPASLSMFGSTDCLREGKGLIFSQPHLLNKDNSFHLKKKKKKRVHLYTPVFKIQPSLAEKVEEEAGRVPSWRKLGARRADTPEHAWCEGVAPGMDVNLPCSIPLASVEPCLKCLLGLRTSGK